MANLFYAEEICNIIAKAALEIQMQPQKTILANQTEHSIESLELLNDRVAQYNAGIQSLALCLMNALNKSEDEKDE